MLDDLFAIGGSVADLETPALVVDLDVLDVNIAAILSTCRQAGVVWRPHIKSIKSPALAVRLLSAGAIGVTCATLGEAVTMAEGGIRDILIANQVVGAGKVQRLMQLAQTCDVCVAVDSARNVAELAKAARRAGLTLPVLIEVDIGLRRAGVRPGGDCLRLAQAITSEEGLELRGLMGWEGHAAREPNATLKAIKVTAAVLCLVRSAELCRERGLPIDTVSCGGTGTYRTTATVKGVTEIQAGGGVFSDVRARTELGLDHPYALTVMGTVISRPTSRRVICDVGRKSMSMDAAEPIPLSVPRVKSLALSAEHATIATTIDNDLPAVGDRVEFVVGYADTTVFLHNQIYGVRNGVVEEVFLLPDSRRP